MSIIKFAIPKGSLEEATFQFLAEAGYNISSGKSTSVLKIVKIIERLLNKKANLVKKVNQYTNMNIMISNKKILDHLSNFKFTTIEEGIQTIVNQIVE